jgi:hypothetical protein
LVRILVVLEIMTAIDGDDGTVPGLMTTAGSLTAGEKRHNWQLRGSKTVHVPSIKNLFAALPTTDRYAKTSVQQDFGKYTRLGSNQ